MEIQEMHVGWGIMRDGRLVVYFGSPIMESRKVDAEYINTLLPRPGTVVALAGAFTACRSMRALRQGGFDQWD